MGAVVSSLRADEFSGDTNSSPSIISSSSSNQPDTRIAKKPRLSWFRKARQVFGSPGKTFWRLYQYPQTKPRPKSRADRFGSALNRSKEARSCPIGIGGVFDDAMGNLLGVRRKCEVARESYKSPHLKKRLDEREEAVDSAHFREPFLPLNEEEKETVAKAFSNSNRRKVLVFHESSNIEITGQVLLCLRPRAWLNDEVINLYFELLKERENREPKKFLRCHFFNTFFYNKLIGGGNGYAYKNVRRWTSDKKLGYGLNKCDIIFVPIHKEVHWCLGVINKKDRKFQYLDSFGGKDSQVLKVLATYFVDEMKDKCGQDIDVTSWEHEFVKDLPLQENGSDCGVFMIKYADFYSRGMKLNFSQEHVPNFRLRIAKEILQLRAD